MKRNFLLLCVALALALAGCGGGPAASSATPTPFPTPVRQTFTVQRGNITVEAKFGGRIAPLALQTVYFQIDGQVSEVYANVNDVVEEGQLLGELAQARELRTQAGHTKRTIRRAQIKLEVAELTLQQYKAQGRSEAEIKIQELQVESAKMDLEEVLEGLGIDPEAPVVDELDAQVARARVYAPADGTIISAVNVGRNVSLTTPAFVLGDPDKLEAIVDLDVNSGDDQIKEMYEGMPVIITPESKPDLELAGTIRQLPSPYGTGPSDSHKIHIVLEEPPSADTYQNGDKVRVTIQLASKEEVLWLPPEAVRQAGGRTFVIINSDSGPKRVDIEIGLQTRDRVEIGSGLEEGQVVVGP